MNQPLLYLGLTHQSAPPSLRDHVHPDRVLQTEILDHSASLARGRMILSTCERFEFYASKCCFDTNCLATQLADWLDVPGALLARNAIVLRDDAVAAHLMRVAAGLESRILGEAQILGQLRDAFLFAEASGALDATLSALGRAAIRAGKRVRSETSLNAGARSIATIAMDWLAERGAAISDARVLILGSGGLAGVVAAEVVRRSPKELAIVGRTIERCQELARKHRATGNVLRELPTLLARAEVVFACATADQFLIDPRTFTLRPAASPLFVVDLAVPRIVDPALAGISQVHLSHLDELLQSAPKHVEGVTTAEAIVRCELEKFIKWRRERAIVARIRALTASACGTTQESQASPYELHRCIERIKAEAAA